MKGLLWTFGLGITLLLGTYAVLIGAISLPGKDVPHTTEVPAVEPDKPAPGPAKDADDTVTLTREAAQNVIDCYAGKPVYLVPGTSRPLYPPCDRLLRIYMDETSDPERVLALLAEPDKGTPVD